LRPRSDRSSSRTLRPVFRSTSRPCRPPAHSDRLGADIAIGLSLVAAGGAAGGCSSLWLAFHDDLADPKNSDPVARESTRLHCAAVNGAQVSLDPKEVREWLPNYTYGAHAFGLKTLDEVEAQWDKLAAWIKEYCPSPTSRRTTRRSACTTAG
jgi:hypothetical protein